MKPLILLVAILFAVLLSGEKCSAQLFGARSVGINWNPECALQSAQTYASCRANGGGNWRCLVNAGFDYWSCSGSTFEMATVGPARRARAAVAGYRVLRKR